MFEIHRSFWRRRWMLVFTITLLILVLSLFWNPRTAEGQLAGYSQVSRLEVGYVLERQSIQARISLASGYSLDYEPTNDRDIEVLFKMAKIFSERGPRLFVVIKDDKIRSFQVSIP